MSILMYMYVYIYIIDIYISSSVLSDGRGDIAARRVDSLTDAVAAERHRVDGVAAASIRDTAPYGLDDLGHLIDKRDGARDVVQDLDVPHLLPGHGQVLEELVDGMRYIL